MNFLMMRKSLKTKENMKESKELKPSVMIMGSENIDTRIIQKRNKLIDIHASIGVYSLNGLSYEARAKGLELQDRLEFRTKQYEEKLLDEKIEIYSELLKILKK